jgi:DNA-binding PadR family transcriptional regulator
MNKNEGWCEEKEFIIEVMENIEETNKNNLMVKQTSTGWFYPNLSKMEAEVLCNKLNEPFETKNAHSIEEYFNEWEKNIDEITEKETERITLKEAYHQLEQKIIDETDFKDLYGKNNETVRKNHVKAELKDENDMLNDLKLRIDYLKRRNDFINSLLSMQKTLIECGYLE